MDTEPVLASLRGQSDPARGHLDPGPGRERKWGDPVAESRFYPVPALGHDEDPHDPVLCQVFVRQGTKHKYAKSDPAGSRADRTLSAHDP